jgi:hypothetical protein
MMRRDVNLEHTFRRALGRAGVVEGYRHVCRRKGCGHVESASDQEQQRCPVDGRKLWVKPVVRPFRFHDLRHTTGSLLIMSGADLAAVQRILRYNDPKLTTRSTRTSRRNTCGPRWTGCRSGRRCCGPCRTAVAPSPQPSPPLRGGEGETWAQGLLPGCYPRSPPGRRRPEPGAEKLRSSGLGIWSGKRDSNPRPSAWEADALPTELFPRILPVAGSSAADGAGSQGARGAPRGTSSVARPRTGARPRFSRSAPRTGRPARRAPRRRSPRTTPPRRSARRRPGSSRARARTGRAASRSGA